MEMALARRTPKEVGVALNRHTRMPNTEASAKAQASSVCVNSRVYGVDRKSFIRYISNPLTVAYSDFEVVRVFEG